MIVEFERGDDTYEFVAVGWTFEPGHPGCASGPPDAWEPPEGCSVDIFDYKVRKVAEEGLFNCPGFEPTEHEWETIHERMIERISEETDG